MSIGSAEAEHWKAGPQVRYSKGGCDKAPALCLHPHPHPVHPPVVQDRIAPRVRWGLAMAGSPEGRREWTAQGSSRRAGAPPRWISCSSKTQGCIIQAGPTSRSPVQWVASYRRPGNPRAGKRAALVPTTASDSQPGLPGAKAAVGPQREGAAGDGRKPPPPPHTAPEPGGAPHPSALASGARFQFHSKGLLAL